MKARIGQDNHSQQQESGRPLVRNDLARPQYEFYEAGVRESRTGWLSVIYGFFKDRTIPEIIAIVAVVALWRIADEFIKKGTGLDGMSLAGCLVTATMIFGIGLVALYRATKQYNAKTTQERQRKTTEFGVETGRPEQDGATPG